MIEERTDLERRWNIAAGRAGIAGSEYIDEPERVFDEVLERREGGSKLARKLGEKNVRDNLERLLNRRVLRVRSSRTRTSRSAMGPVTAGSPTDR